MKGSVWLIIVGLVINIVGIHVWQWQFWLLIVTIVTYGLFVPHVE